MPLYEYLCAKCGKLFEKIEKFSAPRKQKCPHCGGKAERQISASGFQLKGAGWYVTDYARSGSSAAKTDDSAAGSTEAKDTKDTKEPKDTKETKEPKETKESKEKKEPKKEKKQK